MIAVIDSGIWISALEFGGIPRLAIERANFFHRIGFCKQIETEVVDVLDRKFGRLRENISLRLRNYLKDALIVDVPRSLTGVCRDPNDDFLLECVQLVGADLLISGDRDLLSLESFEHTRIVTARQFLELRP